MTGPVRIQLSRRKGWRKPPGAVSVARPHRWGNPLLISRWLPTKATLIDAYRKALLIGAGVISLPTGDFLTASDARRELRGRDLACWCPLPKPGEPDLCHAAVLLEVANS